MGTDCYAVSLRMATRRVSAIYDAALAPVGVSVAQWSLLRSLPPDEADGLTIQALADRVELERSTVARNVRVLERLGLVAVGESERDRRSATIRLTAGGAAVLVEGRPLWEAAQRRVEESLGDTAAQELRRLALSL